MKAITVLVVCFLALPLWFPLRLQAQAALSLSDLSLPSAGTEAVANDQWIAAQFQTGSSTGGYILNSVQVLMGAATGNPGGFTVSIYNLAGSPQNYHPGSSLGTLVGPDSAIGGIFTYTASGLQLSDLTPYYIVVSAGTPLGSGAYAWSYENSESFYSVDRWIPGFSYTSSEGSSWSLNENIFQYGIYTTAVPEPSTSALLGLGLAAWCLCRRRS